MGCSLKDHFGNLQVKEMEYDGDEQRAMRKYECLLFDLDETLYPSWAGLSTQVAKNIEEYMIQKLGIEESKVSDLSLSLYKYYGTTMAGLRAFGYEFDYDDFHSFVHERLSYDILKADPVLRNLLLSVPLRKFVFTNADKSHATRVLGRLGLEDCFEGIICFETLNETNKGSDAVDQSSKEISDINEYSAAANAGIQFPKSPLVCKPFEESFTKVFKIASINPHKTLFFDDSIRNLQTGKRLGLTTVWIGSSHRSEGVDYALESIHNIKEELPELWESEDKSEAVRYTGEVGIETTVKA